MSPFLVAMRQAGTILGIVLLPLLVDSAVAAPLIYVNSRSNGTITVIDAATNNIVRTLTIAPNDSWDVVLNTTGDTLYVARPALGSVQFIDAVTGATIATIPTDGVPSQLTFNPVNGRLYVRNGTLTSSNPITVIDTFARARTATIANADISAIRLDLAGRFLYVSHQYASTIDVISTATNTIVRSLNNRDDLLASGFALNSSGSLLYLANWALRSVFEPPPGADIVTVIDVAQNTIRASISVGDQVADVLTDPRRPREYVVAYRHLAVIDTRTNTVVSSLAVPDEVAGLALTADGSRLYLTSRTRNVVTVLDAETLTVLSSIAVNSPDVVATVLGTGPGDSGAQVIPTLSSAGLIFATLLVLCAALFSLRRGNARRY